MSISAKAVSIPRQCPDCGVELPSHIPVELCPKCLLKAGIAGEHPECGVDEVEAGRPVIGEVFGQYKLTRFLGAGGMGAVYEAEDLESDRHVALKILSQRFDSPEARQRFLREGRLAAAINHPNSVYVFGTGDVGGVPVIAMELIQGGTLEDQVRASGPMEFRKAVDAVVQLIDGLEVAHAAGILHRDIKPSNCFIDSDGTVKIGDFGLSISGEGGADPSRYDDVVFAGTPAFSAPEQLRGERLTVQSDIYSVGVTLFYLLTGHLPYESSDRVRLLSMILENPPQRLADYRPDLPHRLCDIVRDCLEKNPADRFPDYAKLRRELVPFGTMGAVPATPAVRFLGGAVDLLLIGLVCLPVYWLRVPEVSWGPGDGYAGYCLAVLKTMILVAVAVGYFALMEGRCGKSLGKMLFRLRVVTTSTRPPGYPQSLARAAIFIGAPILLAWMPSEEALSEWGRSPGIYEATFKGCIGLLLLFVVARRRNGFLAIHDWVSRTQVLMGADAIPRPVVPLAVLPSGVMLKGRIGPYHVLDCVDGDENWLAGYDCRLLRSVWIHRVPSGTPPVLKVLRDLGRPGRLRWLFGKRSPSDNWDAFEAAAGQPFLKVIQQPQSWGKVKFWLCDLAIEILHSLNAASLPERLDLHRVWITREGRAKLFDFPVPGLGLQEAPAGSGPVDWPAARLFLGDVAARALVSCPLPVYATTFLEELPAIPTAEEAVQRLKGMLYLPESVSKLKRLGLAASGAVVPLMAGIGYQAVGNEAVDVALCIAAVSLLIGVVMPAILLAPLGGGMAMRLAGVGIVRADGRPASGARLVARSLMAWLPVLLSPWVVMMLANTAGVRLAWVEVWGVVILMSILSAVWKGRTIPDRLMGTCLVPR